MSYLAPPCAPPNPPHRAGAPLKHSSAFSMFRLGLSSAVHSLDWTIIIHAKTLAEVLDLQSPHVSKSSRLNKRRQDSSICLREVHGDGGQVDGAKRGWTLQNS